MGMCWLDHTAGPCNDGAAALHHAAIQAVASATVAGCSQLQEYALLRPAHPAIRAHKPSRVHHHCAALRGASGSGRRRAAVWWEPLRSALGIHAQPEDSPETGTWAASRAWTTQLAPASSSAGAVQVGEMMLAPLPCVVCSRLPAPLVHPFSAALPYSTFLMCCPSSQAVARVHGARAGRRRQPG
jgi:hypothetical protein